MNEMHQLLHGIAIKKHVDLAALAALTGLPQARAKDRIEHAVATGRIAEAQGKYVLTSAGRMILEGQYGRYWASVRDDEGFVSAYDRFEQINAELKQIITDWQTMDVGGAKVANDHSSREYDDKILDRLSDVHERMEPIFRVFKNASHRFGYFQEKLAAALEQAEDGDHEWVSDAKIESYHTVWFEMHEDLLRILDRQRID